MQPAAHCLLPACQQLGHRQAVDHDYPVQDVQGEDLGEAAEGQPPTVPNDGRRPAERIRSPKTQEVNWVP